MARASTPMEMNSFASGLITEASPLTFPDNASLDEENFVLNRDKSRSRRQGFDLEDDYVTISTTETPSSDGSMLLSCYRWTNVGGDGSKTFIVVQTQNTLNFFDCSVTPLSSGLIGTYTYDDTDTVVRFSYATVDGMLVVVTGRKDIDTFTWDGTDITILTKRLYIRDQFGLTDISLGA